VEVLPEKTLYPIVAPRAKAIIAITIATEATRLIADLETNFLNFLCTRRISNLCPLKDYFGSIRQDIRCVSTRASRRSSIDDCSVYTRRPATP
jgi:hypothetical protein